MPWTGEEDDNSSSSSSPFYLTAVVAKAHCLGRLALVSWESPLSLLRRRDLIQASPVGAELMFAMPWRAPVPYQAGTEKKASTAMVFVQKTFSCVGMRAVALA